MSLIVLCFLHSTSVLSLYKDVVLTLSTKRSYQIVRFKRAFLCVFHQYFSAYVAKCKLLFKKANLRDLVAATSLVFLPKIGFKSLIFFAHVTMKFYVRPRKTIGHLFYAMSSFVHHFKAICDFKLELQSGNTKFESKWEIFFPCDIKIWQMTLKNNRALLLCNFKLCVLFHSHLSIQNGVTVRKSQIWIKIGDFLSRVTLKFDGWP